MHSRPSAIVALLLVALCGAAMAEELPRWKFAAGDQLRWQVTQRTKLDIVAGDAGDTSSEAHQTLDIVWRVDDVADDGTMHGKQLIERIQVNIVQPTGLTLEYDSQADEGAEALSAMLLPLFETLLEAEVPVSISPLGEVTECMLTEEQQKRLAGIPATRAMSDLVSETGIRNLVQLIALPLPAEGQQSASRPVDLSNRVLGTLTGELTWKLAESDGNIQKLAPELTLSLEPAEPPSEDEYGQPQPLGSPNIKHQSVEGTAEFDRERGQLTQSSRTVHLTITGQTMGADVEMRMEQHVEVTPQ